MLCKGPTLIPFENYKRKVRKIAFDILPSIIVTKIKIEAIKNFSFGEGVFGLRSSFYNEKLDVLNH